MKTIIAGSRGFTNPDLIEQAVAESGFHITEVVSGHADGIDKLAEAWARKQPNMLLRLFPAAWSSLGKRAGYVRNLAMANYAEAAILIWDGKSKGTKMMCNLAQQHGLKTFLKVINK